ncbi:hypothetical protein EGW08_002846 [Elysia chlorotica]|uniref:Glucose-methanol-choline oxidoreductase N-terminal domain-containing protein n=1 Tax=Elysia chlorotica TaxID=188477 RepID=A0A433U6D5_ELYCH|nr:hypothetical protein EGW08_002846 [Elysia chlorotica]
MASSRALLALTVLLVAVAWRVFFSKYKYFQNGSVFVTKFNSSYDFIVVGGGAAGSVLAARLSENKDITILLLEAGGSDWGNPKIDTPGMAPVTLKTDVDWDYTAEPQDGLLQGLRDERPTWPRGKVLGGSSSINAMIVVRGFKSDYDRWAQYTGDRTWDYAHLLHYFKKMEDMRVPELRDSEFHGKDGPLKVEHCSDTSPLSHKFVEAGKSMGYADSIDYNTGATKGGVFYIQHNRANGERLSASKAYLYPAMDRPNLHIAINSHVQKIVIEDKRAVGVELIKDGQKHLVRSRREVVLSAGAIGSAHILLLSGVGPREQLQNLHIPVKADLPVGHNLQDHIFIDLIASIEQPLSWTSADISSWWSILKYQFFGTGILALPYACETVAFKCIRKEAKEQEWPDLQLHIASLVIEAGKANVFNRKAETDAELSYRDAAGYGFTCLPSLLRPESRGNISLVTSDPFDYPRIHANYLDSEMDVEMLIDGVEECKRLINSQPMKAIGSKLMDAVPIKACKHHKFDSREYWACVIRRTPLTIYHPVGTCKMGPQGDPSAVLDSKLRVQGISGLRVADASVMPWVTSGNTHIPTIAIAEKAADLLLERNPLPPNKS